MRFSSMRTSEPGRATGSPSWISSASLSRKLYAPSSEVAKDRRGERSWVRSMRPMLSPVSVVSSKVSSSPSSSDRSRFFSHPSCWLAIASRIECVADLAHVARADFGLVGILVFRDQLAVSVGGDRVDVGIGARALATQGGGQGHASARKRPAPARAGFALVLDRAGIQPAAFQQRSIGGEHGDRAAAAVVVQLGLQLQRQVQCLVFPAPAVFPLALRRQPAIGGSDCAGFERGLGGRVAATHHVGQDRVAAQVDARRATADQFDALHRRRPDALEQLADVLALARRARAVDQHVALRRGVAAHVGVGFDDAETRQALDHVAGVGRRIAGEVFARILGHARGAIEVCAMAGKAVQQIAHSPSQASVDRLPVGIMVGFPGRDPQARLGMLTARPPWMSGKCQERCRKLGP